MTAVRTERADHVAVITLDDVAGRNALSEQVVHELLAALASVGADRSVHAVVLAGRGDVFCAGASRDMLRALVTGRVAPTDILLPRAILDLPVPVISAMAGHAIGGGFALGLCADLVVIARESRYGASFMNMGFTPGMGMTRLLEHVLSRAVAHELLFTGEARRGDAFATNAGFNYVLPRAEVLPKALDLAARIAENSRFALEALKRTLAQPRREAFEATRTTESLMHEACFAQPDIAARIEDNYE
jgi:polyketide biosynthesis enoyl-CoA hydratase PksI